jgi:hypothetical protein
MARNANALNLGDVLERAPGHRVPAGAIPTSGEVSGPADDAAAICSATSVQSVSPPRARLGRHRGDRPAPVRSGWPTGSGMAGFGRKLRKDHDE